MSDVIKFTLQTTDKSSKVILRVAKTIKRVGKAMKAMAVAAIATIASVLAFTKVIANAQDEAGKTALKIGLAVGELTKMQFAAKLSGIRVETFNMGIQRMQRRMGEAAKGTGEALGALRDLGISAKSFVKLPLSEQLEKLADKFNAMGEGSEQLRTAFKLFDSEGVVMLQMLKKGSPAMREMANEAERFGLVVSAQAAANAEKFNDKLVSLQGAATGAAREVGNALIPVITGLAERLTEFVVDNRDGIASFFDSMTLGAVTFGIIAEDVFDSVSKFLSKVFDGSIFNDFLDLAVNTFNSLIKFIAPLDNAIASTLINGFKAVWDGFVSLASSAIAIIINTGPKWVVAYAKIILGSFKILWDGFVALGSGAWEAVMSILSGAPPKDILGGIFDKLKNDTEESRGNVKGLLGELKGLSIDAGDTFIDNLLGDTKESSDKFMKALGEIRTSATAIAEGIANKTGSVIDGVAGVGDGLLESAGVRAKALLNLIRSTADSSGKINAKTEAETISFMDSFKAQYETFMSANKSIAEQLGLEVQGILLSSIAGFGDAIAASIVQGQNLMESLKAVAQQVLQSIISMLIQIGVQRLIAAAIGKQASASEGASELGVKAAIAYANGFNASSALGIIGLAAAPAVGAASSATMLSGASAAGATGSAVGGALGTFHGGLDFVPSEQTALLDRGERIVSPNQNRDLTEFLNDGGAGSGASGGVIIENLNVLPNATNAEALLNMRPEDMQRIVEDKIIKALDDLNKLGTRPEAAT